MTSRGDTRFWSRRDVMRAGGAAVLAVATPVWAGRRRPLPEYEHGGTLGIATMFSHGVASGDPLPDGIVLWTRVSPEPPGRIEVFWEMALDSGFHERVAAGRVVTD